MKRQRPFRDGISMGAYFAGAWFSYTLITGAINGSAKGILDILESKKKKAPATAEEKEEEKDE